MSRIILGVDFGDARTGLAVAGRSGSIAVGAGLIRADGFKKALAAVSEAAKREKAELIVVGNPLNMNGSAGPRSEKCRDFAAALEEETGIETVLYDERLTTVSAHRYLSDTGVSGKKRKESVDADPSGLYRSVSGKARLIGNAVMCFAAGIRQSRTPHFKGGLYARNNSTRRRAHNVSLRAASREGFGDCRRPRMG